MARSRTISPRFFKNDALGILPPEARLLFIGLWTLADRSGRLEDRPAKIRAEIFPYGCSLQGEEMLNLLDRADLIFRYSIEDADCVFGYADYIQIPKWFSYQRPHPHEVESVIPPIPCDLIDFKRCRDFSVTSRDKSRQNRILAAKDATEFQQQAEKTVLKSTPNSPQTTDSSGSRDLVLLSPSFPSFPSLNTVQANNACTSAEADEFSLTGLNPASNGKKPPKARRTPANETWPEWKRVTWATLLREDPKREYCAGAKTQFATAIQTETQADWLVQAHRKQILDTPDSKFWPGFSKWLQSALTLLDAGLSIAEVSQEREPF